MEELEKVKNPEDIPYPPSAKGDEAKILKFIEEAELWKPGHWRDFKRLYKLEEAEGKLRFMAALIARIDVAALEIEKPASALASGDTKGSDAPSSKTVAYMKRRARRFLRNLGESDPDEYFKIVQAVLEVAADQREELDLGSQWVCLDLLYGNGERVSQSNHSRARFRFASYQVDPGTPEQRHSELWDRNCEGVRDLLAKPTLAWNVYETGYLVLDRNSFERPKASAGLVDRFARAPSILLLRVVEQRISEALEKGKIPKADWIAGICARGDDDLRETVRAIWGKLPGTKKWRQQLSKSLLSLVREDYSRDLITGDDVQSISTFICERLGDVVTLKLLSWVREERLDREDSAARSLMIQAIRNSGVPEIMSWLTEIEVGECRLKSDYADALIENASELQVSLTQAKRLVSFEDPSIAALSWRFLLATAPEEETALKLWEWILERPYTSEFYRAMDSVEALELLAQTSSHAAELVGRRAMIDPRLLYVLVRSKDERLHSIALSWAAQSSPRTALLWLESLRHLEKGLRADLIEVLVNRWKNESFPADVAGNMVCAQNERICRDAWHILSRVSLNSHFVAGLWSEIREDYRDEPRICAFRSTHFFCLMQEAGLVSEAFEFLADKEILLSRLSGTAVMRWWEAAIESPLRIELMPALSPGFRDHVKEPLLRKLRSSKAKRRDFWKGFADVINSDDGTLTTWLAENHEFVESFVTVFDPDFFSIRKPGFEGVLDQWMGQHMDSILDDRALLWKAAKHEFGVIRRPAIEHLARLGLSTASALRLMESGFPDCIECARSFFESEAHSTEKRYEILLAVCDSPHEDVQEYGRAFLEANRETLSMSQVIRDLSEHSGVKIQEVVASLALDSKADGEAMRNFDSRVLRAKNRGRRTKELVKTRPELDSTASVDLLLEVARSGPVRDREWARQRLAKLSLSGVQIAGFSTEEIYGV